MILKKVEKENVVKAIYKSSNILASEYNRDTKELNIIFNRGAKYRYTDVNPTNYTRFEIAESQGKVFNSHIKNKHVDERLEDIDPTKIVDEVNTIAAAELKALGEGITKAMEKAVKEFNKSEIHVRPTLNNLQYLIARYINESNG